MEVSVLKSLARHGVRLAVSFVLLTGVAGVCHAQAAAAQSATKATAPVATPAKAAPAPQVARTAAPGQRRPGGNREGIQVHGQWVIEVRDPDGKLVSRTEFENSLNTPQTILSNLLTGTATYGSWQVELGTSSDAGGPCGTSGLAVCLLGQSGSGAFNSASSALNCSAAGNCFTTLQVSLASATTGGPLNEIQLTGQATANASGQIGYVETDVQTCTNPEQAPPPSTISPSSCFTTFTPYAELTSATNFPGSPVTVNPNQTISVNVTISFAPAS